MTRLNVNGMPAAAMWLQCLLVGVFIVLVSFGGDSASAFYNKLTLMANVSMTLPYLFLTIAFPFFKAKTHLDRPFVIFKNRPSTLLATGVVLLVVTFANIFTIIQPVIDSGDWNSTLWMVGGPIFFSLLALGIYESYRRRMASGAGDGELKSLPGGAAGQGWFTGYQPYGGWFFRPRSWFYCFACRQYFQTHLERRTAYQCHARGSPPDQLMHLMAQRHAVPHLRGKNT